MHQNLFNAVLQLNTGTSTLTSVGSGDSQRLIKFHLALWSSWTCMHITSKIPGWILGCTSETVQCENLKKPLISGLIGNYMNDKSIYDIRGRRYNKKLKDRRYKEDFFLRKLVFSVKKYCGRYIHFIFIVQYLWKIYENISHF